MAATKTTKATTKRAQAGPRRQPEPTPRPDDDVPLNPAQRRELRRWKLIAKTNQSKLTKRANAKCVTLEHMLGHKHKVISHLEDCRAHERKIAEVLASGLTQIATSSLSAHQMQLRARAALAEYYSLLGPRPVPQQREVFVVSLSSPKFIKVVEEQPDGQWIEVVDGEAQPEAPAQPEEPAATKPRRTRATKATKALEAAG